MRASLAGRFARDVTRVLRAALQLREQKGGLPAADFAVQAAQLRTSVWPDLWPPFPSPPILAWANRLNSPCSQVFSHTERILSRPVELSRLGAIASLHHERLDGSGYHRRAARLLAAPTCITPSPN